MINVGDIVRVTSKTFPNSAIEGQVVLIMDLQGYKQISVRYLGFIQGMSTKNHYFEVLSRVEPKELGHIHKEHIRWTTEKFGYPWINTRTGKLMDWESILVQTEDEQC